MDTADKLMVILLVAFSLFTMCYITVPRIKTLNKKVAVLETRLNHFVLDTAIYPTDCGQDTIVTIEYK